MLSYMNIIDFNKLNSIFIQLNEYFSFYNLLDQNIVYDKIKKEICLKNNTDYCWDIDDDYFENEIKNKNETNLNKVINFNFSTSLNFSSFNDIKYELIYSNLLMPIICTIFFILLYVQNQNRKRIIHLNELVRKVECISGLQQIKEDMKVLAKTVDELKYEKKKNESLRLKLDNLIDNNFINKNLDINSNLNITDNIQPYEDQITQINHQLKLNQLEQSKLKYMVCKTIESFDRILLKMKNSCEILN